MSSKGAILAIIAILVLAGVVGYLALSKKPSETPEETNQPPEGLEEGMPQPTSSIDDLASALISESSAEESQTGTETVDVLSTVADDGGMSEIGQSLNDDEL